MSSISQLICCIVADRAVVAVRRRVHRRRLRSCNRCKRKLRRQTSRRRLRHDCVRAATDENGNPQLPARLQRQIVKFPTHEAPGMIIIDTANTFLYYILGSGKAIRYGIGVGREGFTWSGVKSVARKAEWPDWHPPTQMIVRQPYLRRMVAGGQGNPLARARSISVVRNIAFMAPMIRLDRQTCLIRLLNDDVIDLYNRVTLGARVIVLSM